MPHPTKIVTCCYCGTRAAMVLRGDVSHRLTCETCGAPISDIKRLPLAQGDSPTSTPAARPKTAPTAKKKKPRDAAKWTVSHQPSRKKPSPKRKPKKRKSALRWFLEEAKDAIEDIFD